MARNRSRSRGSKRFIGPTGILFALLLASAVAGASVVPTSSFSLASVDRGNSIDVVEDQNGALGLQVAPTVQVAGTHPLVTVTNNLGIDGLSVTVKLLDHAGSTLHAGANSDSPTVTFTMNGGDSQLVEIDPTGPPGQLTFEITATGDGMTATMERTTQVVAGPIDLVIDIKPGSATNPINLQSQGVTPVAVLQTGGFDPTTQLDVATLRFGEPSAVDSGGGASPAHGGHVEDVDGDGDDDLVLHFPTQSAGFTAGSAQGTLVGQTVDGASAAGTDSITIVGPPGGGGPPGDGDEGDGEDGNGEDGDGDAGGSGGPAYEDVNHDGDFDAGTDIQIPTSELTDGEYDAGSNGLVIPAAVGSITADEIDLRGQGVTVEVDLTATSKAVTIDAKSGSITASGIDVSAGKELTLAAGGSIEVSNSDLTADKEITIEAGGALSMMAADLSAGKEIAIEAGGSLAGSNAQLTADKEIAIEAGGAVTVMGAHLTAGQEITIEAGGSIASNGATFDAPEVEV